MVVKCFCCAIIGSHLGKKGIPVWYNFYCYCYCFIASLKQSSLEVPCQALNLSGDQNVNHCLPDRLFKAAGIKTTQLKAPENFTSVFLSLDHCIANHLWGTYVGGALQPGPYHLPELSADIILCCQITKWLFACCKQRKQILYRYYIYIDMFFLQCLLEYI